jgi:cobalt-zinc-cadmium efflux system membrane fusion protein
MATPIKRWSSAVAAAIPPLLVCGLLAGVAYWGHSTGWQARKFSAAFPTLAERLGLSAAAAVEAPDDDKRAEGPITERVEGPADWCDRHGVADSLCSVCHPELATRRSATPPPEADVAIRPSHDPKQCRTHLEVIRFPSAEAVQLAGIQTAAAEVRPVDETVTAYGVVEYDEFRTAKLGPRAAGAIWQTYKRLGDRVAAGDVLALIDSADVGRAKAEFLQAAVQLDARTRARAALHPGSVAERIIQEADAAVREAAARLYTAQQALLTLGLPLRGDEAALPDDKLRDRLQFLGIPNDVAKALPAATTTANLLPVVAPFAGTVIERKAVRGEMVAAHQPLLTVSDLSSVHVLLDLRPEDTPRLKVGQRVDFRADGDGGPPAVGELHWISPALDEKTRLVHAHAEVPNLDGRLRANAFGSGTVFVRRHDAALLIPADAVQWEGCSYAVFVRESPTAFRPRKVRLGVRQDRAVEILVGLKPGETVVTAGSHVLKSHLFRDRLGAAED